MTTETLSIGISRTAYKLSYAIDLLISFAKVILKYLVKASKSILNALIEARTRQAEYEIAKMLQTEYRNENFHYILQKLREGRLDELSKK